MKNVRQEQNEGNDPSLAWDLQREADNALVLRECRFDPAAVAGPLAAWLTQRGFYTRSLPEGAFDVCRSMGGKDELSIKARAVRDVLHWAARAPLHVRRCVLAKARLDYLEGVLIALGRFDPGMCQEEEDEETLAALDVIGKRVARARWAMEENPDRGPVAGRKGPRLPWNLLERMEKRLREAGFTDREIADQLWDDTRTGDMPRHPRRDGKPDPKTKRALKDHLDRIKERRRRNDADDVRRIRLAQHRESWLAANPGKTELDYFGSRDFAAFCEKVGHNAGE